MYREMLDIELSTHGLDRLSGFYVTVYWFIQYHLKVYIGAGCLNTFEGLGHAQSVSYTALYAEAFFLQLVTEFLFVV